MKFLDELKKVLISDERFVGEANQIIKTKVSDAARANNEKLLKDLLNNDLLKEAFFTKVDDIYVFDKNKFVWVLESKEFLPDSFTMYKNKIGLVDSNNNLISQKQDISLVWPYKDCVLEGGQTKEDQKREEIFYNETLAPDQVNRLLTPKVLGNAKRYTKDGIDENIEFKEDDNLIIKGNNLLAISSLLERYEGKIDIIYIDPPYNTRTDANTFVYNNSFNHSTWLTFMKNRLEIAKRLLSQTGIIFIDIDHYELFYLGVLADEVFGYENRIGTLAVVHNFKGRYNGFFSVAHENKLVYAKNTNSAIINEFSYDTSENFLYSDNIGRYKSIGLQRTGSESKREDRPNLFYPIYYSPLTKEISLVKKEDFIEILPIDSEGIERRWRWSKDKVQKEWKTEIEVKTVSGQYKVYTKLRQKGDRPKTIWNKPEYSGTTGTNHLKELLGENKFSFPKSVELVMDSLDIASKEDSIILDFFGGSGTTAEAVLKMNERDNGTRKFILVEQMEYINDVTIPRVKNSLGNDKLFSFVYCELLEDNESLVNELEKAENTDKVKIVLNKAIDNGKLIPSVLPSDLKENQDDFDKLSLDDQKNLVMELLNKNQLYVNLSDIDDEDYKVSEADKKFTRSFYGKE